MEQLESNVNILIEECARNMKNTYSWCFAWARFWTQGNQNPRRGCFCVFPWIMWVVMNTIITHFWQSPSKSEPTTCKNDFKSLNANWRLKGCFLTDPNLGPGLRGKKKPISKGFSESYYRQSELWSMICERQARSLSCKDGAGVSSSPV